MKNRWTKTLLISALAVLIIAVGAIAVFAQDGDAPPADESPVPLPRGHWRGHHGGYGDGQAGLADALGITVEELEAAQREAKIAQITQAVEDGYLSKDQGNLMVAMILLKESIDRQALLASALEMDIEELEAAIEDGTLREKLGEVTPADLKQGMEDAFEEALQKAVDDMLITEEQVELVREHFGNGFGYHRGYGGGYGRGPSPHGGYGPGRYPGMHTNSPMPSQNF